jgi:hypothetical protein
MLDQCALLETSTGVATAGRSGDCLKASSVYAPFGLSIAWNTSRASVGRVPATVECYHRKAPPHFDVSR